MLVDPEYSRALVGFVYANPLENRTAIADHMRKDMDRSFIPRDQSAVVPNCLSGLQHAANYSGGKTFTSPHSRVDLESRLLKFVLAERFVPVHAVFRAAVFDLCVDRRKSADCNHDSDTESFLPTS